CAQEIELYINKTYSGVTYQFPFLTYVQSLTERKTRLENILKNLEHYKPFDFQQGTIENAKDLLNLLNDLLYAVVNTSNYSFQKAQKPLFDKNEELHQQQLLKQKKLLEQELQERTTALENKRRASEAKLLKKTSKAKTVENQRLALERAVSQQKLDKQKIELEKEAIKTGQVIRDALEREAIKNGHIVRDALTKNDAKWAAQCLYLQNELKKSATQTDGAVVSEKERNELKTVIANLRSELAEIAYTLEIRPSVCAQDHEAYGSYMALLRRQVTAVQRMIPNSL
ncbi:hypothetical protein H0X06_03995, partial [Candidatus Dependentiae bacterium]|nr:hypothetical protein [Candidatus Dependentiae bacterium]